MEEIPYAEEVKELHIQNLNRGVKTTPKKNKELTLNCIMCLHCNDVIVSDDNVDGLIPCKCGKVAINGGMDYLRRTGVVDKDYEELSIWKP